MEFTLNADAPANELEETSASPVISEEGFSISAQPVVAEVEQRPATDELPLLPRSYRTQTLWIVPRDPESLFAFWDVDWPTAFATEKPAQRKVHLRLIRDDGSEETMLEMEPMASNCYINDAKPGATYTADLGFYQTGGDWHSIALSAAVEMPTAGLSAVADGDFATIPLHLDFQRMIDALRVSHHESASLTDMIADVRRRAATGNANSMLNAAEQEIVREINAVAESSRVESETPQPPAIDWRQVERIIGFGNSSLNNGFGATSRGS